MPKYMRLRNGRFYTNLFFKGRKIEVSLGTSNERRATVALGKILEALDNGEEVVGSRRSIGRLKYPGQDQRGIRIWDMHVKPFFRSCKIQEIDGPMIEQYIADRWGGQAPQSTVKKELRVLKAVICKAKPRWEVPEFKYQQTEKKEKPPLTPAMVEAAVKCLKGHWQNLIGFRVMQYTGIEPKDVTQLAPCHFVDGFIRKKRSKSGKAINLPIHPALSKALESVPWPLDKNQPILSGDRFNAKSLATAVTRAFTAAGYPEYSAKDLRRYVASRLMDAGYTEMWIGKALGHAPGSKVTAGYATPYDETLVKAWREAL